MKKKIIDMWLKNPVPVWNRWPCHQFGFSQLTKCGFVFKCRVFNSIFSFLYDPLQSVFSESQNIWYRIQRLSLISPWKYVKPQTQPVKTHQDIIRMRKKNVGLPLNNPIWPYWLLWIDRKSITMLMILAPNEFNFNPL
jgi:hypothetical protein